jgi:NAD(P)-dependent dehydrogenase (short-subunit alcohol dehydrogenase family)
MTTALITGASSGIGRATAINLAALGLEVVLAGRSKERTQQVVDEIMRGGGQASFLPIDLASLDSVAEGANAFLASGAAVGVLVNNAATAGGRRITTDGFEKTFAVNYLGHYLLTRLLLARLCESRPARIINLASDAHYRAKGLDWARLRRSTRSLTGLPEYAVSKLCMILFTRELAKRLPPRDIATYAVHPGLVATNIWRPLPRPVRLLVTRRMLTPAEGAATVVKCATEAELEGDSGGYWSDGVVRTPSEVAQDNHLAAELWERSEKWVVSRGL